jgi:hypothetical protein
MDALRTSFEPGKQHISSQLYVSYAMYRMDGLMICFGHDKQNGSGR